MQSDVIELDDADFADLRAALNEWTESGAFSTDLPEHLERHGLAIRPIAPEPEGGVVNPETGLKACPFCGGNNVSVFGPVGWDRQWGISHPCASFYSGASVAFQGFTSEQEAIAAWNRRASAPESGVGELVEALEGLIDACKAVEQFAGHRVVDPHELSRARTALATYRSRPAEPAVSAEAVPLVKEALEQTKRFLTWREEEGSYTWLCVTEALAALGGKGE